MKPIKRNRRGCEADTLVGVIWLCPQEKLVAWVDMAWSVIERGELKVYQARSAAMDDEVEEKPYNIENGIARIAIAGPLTKHPTSFGSLFGGTSMMRVRDSLRQIRADDSIRGVFLDMDSWGGTAEGTSELADAIAKTDKIKPVFAHAEDKATSAALWLATQARCFTAGPVSAIGSQGTVLKLVDSSEVVKGRGLKPVVISTGSHKTIGAPGMAITDAQKRELQRYVNLVNEPFKQAVADARNLDDEQLEEVATARVFVGEDAKRVGLIDRVCSMDEAFESFQEFLSKGGTAIRGPAPIPSTKVQAASRDKVMAFTPKQISRARATLPGAAKIDDTRMEGFVLDKAIAYRQRLSSLKQENDTLKMEVEELKANPVQTPGGQSDPVMDPALLSGLRRNAKKETSLMAREGRLTSEQVALLGKMFDDKKMGPIMFTPVGEGMLYESFGKVLELNQPNGLLDDISASQPAPRQEPGERNSGNGNGADDGSGGRAYGRGAQTYDIPTVPARQANGQPVVSYERYCALVEKSGNVPVPYDEWIHRRRATAKLSSN